MPLFLIRYIDTPQAAALKAPRRDAHLAYIDAQGPALQVGGPLVDPQGVSIGSVLVFEAADLAAAQAISAADPYSQAGAYASTEIHEYRVMRGAVG